MASSIRQKNATVINRLVRQPHRFTFFQAVRLLIAAGSARSLGVEGDELGTTRNASDEPVRFLSTPALAFAATEIVSVKVPYEEDTELDEEDLPEEPPNSEINLELFEAEPIEMEVAFWGLVGPVGALPSHYTQLMIDRIHAKDPALKDFLDLFSHRQLSLFYRAWEKHFVSVGFERGLRQSNPESDLLRESLMALVGRGTKRVRDRLEILDDVNLFYGGLFIDRANAESLGQLTRDFLGLPVEVLSLFGQWLSLPKSERSRMGTLGGHCNLGVDTVMGDRVWDPTSKFRLRVGPVTYAQFEKLMPTGQQLIPLGQLIRSYVGCEFSFDIQMELLAEEIPECQLGSDTAEASPDDRAENVPANLGWNTWLCSETPQHNSTDAVFHHEGMPVAS